MESYKIITFEKDTDGKNVKVERDATAEEIINIKEFLNKERELITTLLNY
jgi:hypothetical protein